MIEILLFLAVTLVLVLTAIALTLHWRLYHLRKARCAEEKLALEKRVRQKQNINRSIQVIARAFEGQQLGATEASIRISVLLDALDVSDEVKDEFSAFYQLAKEASHIPILDAWKALPKQQRMAFDKELLVLEEKYQDVVLDAAGRIQGRKL
jgi:hypothetical protein